jgi:hypothetical protein
MKKIVLLLSILSIIILASCRKQEKEEIEPTIPVDTLAAKNILGTLLFEVNKSIGKDTNSIVEGTRAHARFHDPYGNPRLINSVSLNGVNLQLNTIEKKYESVAVKDISKCMWSVKGKDSIPDFDYTNNSGLPQYEGYKRLLPDRMDRTKDITLDFSGVKNADHVEVFLIFNNQRIESMAFLATTKSITFSSNDLSIFNKGDTPTFYISLYNYHLHTFSGKNFYFTNEMSFDKSVTIY